MHQVAAQMQLESMRAELRRGVPELPQETTENAAQVRRLIVEKVEALAEPNRIVAQFRAARDAGHGRGGGWLSDLSVHASRDDGPVDRTAPSREAGRSQQRMSCEAVGSLEAGVGLSIPQPWL
jgi:hypothetical protein